MKELLGILEAIKPGVDFENETDLIGKQILASIDIIKLVSKLSDAFDIEIGVTDLVPENFNSVDAMMKMIERLEEE